MPKVGLIDYGAGNFTSVMNALQHLHADVMRITDPVELRNVTHLILPGVGAFAAAMRNLDRLHLSDALRELLTNDEKPFLGICVGMQILATLGMEFEECPGLGLIPGVVDRIPAEEAGLRLPHIGWNELSLSRSSPLFDGMTASPIFYFVHSYHLQADSDADVLATCDYGTDFIAAVQRNRVFGVQFHPEKSQHDGLRLLQNFMAIPA